MMIISNLMIKNKNSLQVNKQLKVTMIITKIFIK